MTEFVDLDKETMHMNDDEHDEDLRGSIYRKGSMQQKQNSNALRRAKTGNMQEKKKSGGKKMSILGIEKVNERADEEDSDDGGYTPPNQTSVNVNIPDLRSNAET